MVTRCSLSPLRSTCHPQRHPSCLRRGLLHRGGSKVSSAARSVPPLPAVGRPRATACLHRLVVIAGAVLILLLQRRRRTQGPPPPRIQVPSNLHLRTQARAPNTHTINTPTVIPTPTRELLLTRITLVLRRRCTLPTSPLPSTHVAHPLTQEGSGRCLSGNLLPPWKLHVQQQLKQKLQPTRRRLQLLQLKLKRQLDQQLLPPHPPLCRQT